MKFSLCLAVSLALAHPTTAFAGSTLKEFTAAWIERDNRYAAQRDELDRDARKALAAFMTAAQQGSPDLNSKMQQMFDAISAVAYVDGRGAVLRDLRIHMDKKATAAGMELWLQEQMDQLRTDSRAAEAKLASAKRMRDDPATKPLDYVQELISAVTMGETLRGKIDELKLSDENLSSYFTAQGEEDAERRAARARIFGAMGAALQSYSAPAPPPAAWSATCNTFGATTTCNGH